MVADGATPGPGDKMSGDGEKKSGSTEERIKTAKNMADRESEETNVSLNQSKGRGQTTATGAMSITNVALLKMVLDGGPEHNRYYELSLVLISVSLALQVVAGFFALIMEQTMSYLDEHGGNYCDGLTEFWCPWRCVTNTDCDDHQHETDDASWRKTSIRKGGPLDDWELLDVEAGSGRGVHSRSTHVVADVREDPMCSCCPFVCTNKVFAKHEIRTLEKYNHWRLHMIDYQLAATRTKEELEFQTDLVEEAKKRLKTVEEALAKPGANKEDLNQELGRIQVLLTEGREEKRKYERRMNKLDILEEQGKLVQEYAVSIRKRRVLKKAAYWQQQLNYIFYIIFILNAFITGFGLDSKPDKTPATNITSAAI